MIDITEILKYMEKFSEGAMKNIAIMQKTSEQQLAANGPISKDPQEIWDLHLRNCNEFELQQLEHWKTLDARTRIMVLNNFLFCCILGNMAGMGVPQQEIIAQMKGEIDLLQGIFKL